MHKTQFKRLVEHIVFTTKKQYEIPEWIYFRKAEIKQFNSGKIKMKCKSKEHLNIKSKA